MVVIRIDPIGERLDEVLNGVWLRDERNVILAREVVEVRHLQIYLRALMLH